MSPRVPGRPPRYTSVARVYDLVSAEPVYRRGRQLAIPLLGLRPGDTVIDIGCGTGLNFSRLAQQIGPDGLILGIDASTDMLRQAGRRRLGAAAPRVQLVQADATRLRPDELGDLLGGPADASLATYSLSLMAAWPAAVDLMLAATRPGGRVGVVDMQVPGRRVLRPVARSAMAAGGADPHAHPWRAVEQRCLSVDAPTSGTAHIQVRVGTIQA